MSSSIPSHVTSMEMSVSYSSISSPNLLVSTPTSMIAGSGMSGLLNSRNLVQDEKLAVATLATLQSGSASTLIKQDLKWIIQSRRRAEGKSEIQVEFKKPVKDELTTEEVSKRARRRELNRLAARRSREKGQRKKDKLVEEICHLQSQNRELVHVLGSLTDERDSIVETLRQHMRECADYAATRYAANGLSQSILEKLGFTDTIQKHKKGEQPPPTSQIYIYRSTDDGILIGHHSPPLSSTEMPSYSSCPTSPVVVGLSGKPVVIEETLPSSYVVPVPVVATAPADDTASAGVVMHNTTQSNSMSPLSTSPPPSLESSSIVSTSSCQLSSSQMSSDIEQRMASPPHQEKLQSLRRNSSHAFEPVHQHSTHSYSIAQDSNEHIFTSPASSVHLRPQRVLLERSFSFPSSHRETRVDYDPNIHFQPSSDVSENDRILPAPMSSIHSHQSFPPHEGSSGLPLVLRLSKSVSEEDQEKPLDLVVRGDKYSNNVSENMQVFSSLPSEINSISRRRSVDDTVYSSYHREPLNLSHKYPSSSSYSDLSHEKFDCTDN